MAITLGNLPMTSYGLLNKQVKGKNVLIHKLVQGKK